MSKRSKSGKQSAHGSGHYAVWTLRAAWLLLPLSVGQAASELLHPLNDTSRTLATIVVWTLWALVLTATMVPLPVTLTILQVSGPASAVFAGWATMQADDGGQAGLGLATALLVAVMVFAAPIADRFVDGASYGDERRFLLRAPGPVVIVLGPISTAIAIAGWAAGPTLLFNGKWAAGGASTLVGWTMAGFSVRALHRLKQRWAVLVPAGFVLHDHLSLAEPALLQRASLAGLTAATADTTALDLTQQARGLAIEVRCRKPHDLLPAGKRGTTELQTVEAFLCSPVRPDALLAEAARRRLPTS